MTSRLVVMNPVDNTVFSERQTIGVAAVLIAGQIANCLTSTGAITVKAPPTPAAKQAFAVLDSDGNAATNAITVDGNGHTIDGGATATMGQTSGAAVFVYDGQQWRRCIERRTFDGSGLPVELAADAIGGTAAPVASVTGTAPITSSGGAAPAIGITAATPSVAGVGGAAGSFAATDKEKLNGIQKQGATTAVAALDIDWSLSATYSKTLAAGANALTFSNSSDGQSITLKVLGAASTLTQPAGVKWVGGAAPVQTPSGTDVYTYINIGGTIYGSVLQGFA